MTCVDITDTVSQELRDEAEKRAARLCRLELGTLMLRYPESLTTSFYLDEVDALGQLRDGKSPMRRGDKQDAGP